MRNQWYGDHRDLVKWGVLVHLAQTHGLGIVLQIAYLRPDSSLPHLEFEMGAFSIPEEVMAHFRNIGHIKDLNARPRVEIRVFDAPFQPQARAAYTAQVVRHIRDLPLTPTAVFLDPDTGVADKPASSAHVTPAEVHTFWQALRPHDWLVLYQHASRQPDWLESRRREFQGACPGSTVHTYRSNTVVRDVALFAATMTHRPA